MVNCVLVFLKCLSGWFHASLIVVPTGNPEQAAMWLEEGFTFVAVDMDLSILAREADRIRALYKD
jgi:2-keto-3-deoxy-L-rhamnonate aldolase RhmA